MKALPATAIFLGAAYARGLRRCGGRGSISLILLNPKRWRIRLAMDGERPSSAAIRFPVYRWNRGLRSGQVCVPGCYCVAGGVRRTGYQSHPPDSKETGGERLTDSALQGYVERDLDIIRN